MPAELSRTITFSPDRDAELLAWLDDQAEQFHIIAIAALNVAMAANLGGSQTEQLRSWIGKKVYYANFSHQYTLREVLGGIAQISPNYCPYLTYPAEAHLIRLVEEEEEALNDC